MVSSYLLDHTLTTMICMLWAEACVVLRRLSYLHHHHLHCIRLKILR